jgi:AraC family transcriptional regulator
MENSREGAMTSTPFGPARFEAGRPMLLAGLRRRHSSETPEQAVGEQWRQFAASGPIPGRVGPNLYGVMCGGDASGFEYLSGAEVESFESLPASMGRMRVPAQQYAVFAHPGPAATLRFTWLKIFDWLERGDYESAHKPDFEVYSPPADPLGGAGGIEVWIGVVPRARGGT